MRCVCKLSRGASCVSMWCVKGSVWSTNCCSSRYDGGGHGHSSGGGSSCSSSSSINTNKYTSCTLIILLNVFGKYIRDKKRDVLWRSVGLCNCYSRAVAATWVVSCPGVVTPSGGREIILREKYAYLRVFKWTYQIRSPCQAFIGIKVSDRNAHQDKTRRSQACESVLKTIKII